MLGELYYAVVQFLAQILDALRVLGNQLLFPPISNRSQKRNECRRTGKNDAFINGVLDERAILLECGAEKRFSGNKKNNEFRRRLKLLPVFFSR